MKDKRLEEQFKEYFDGVNIPDNITGDAKKYVKKRSPMLPRVLKYASIAASFVLVFAASIAIILTTRNSFINKDNNMGGSAPAPETSFTAYYNSDISTRQISPYGISKLNSDLKFIEKLALSSSCSVETQTAEFANGETAHVYANISMCYGMRDDAEIYVEFTEDKVYSAVHDYTNGENGTHKGAYYSLTQETDENGEPVNKLYVKYNDRNYFMKISSSDPYCYLKYIDMIIN